MSKISDKEIADAIESLKYKKEYSGIAREALMVLESAQEEISKLREERDNEAEKKREAYRNINEWQHQVYALQEANTAMLEVLKRITAIVTEHEEAKYQPIGTVRLIGSIVSAAIADIEKGAES